MLHQKQKIKRAPDQNLGIQCQIWVSNFHNTVIKPTRCLLEVGLNFTAKIENTHDQISDAHFIQDPGTETNDSRALTSESNMSQIRESVYHRLLDSQKLRGSVAVKRKRERFLWDLCQPRRSLLWNLDTVFYYE